MHSASKAPIEPKMKGAMTDGPLARHYDQISNDNVYKDEFA